MKKISFDSCFVTDERLFCWKEVDGSVILVDKKEQEVYDMNEAGSIIWNELVKKKTVRDIADRVGARYPEIDPRKITRDTFEFIQGLIRHGVLISK